MNPILRPSSRIESVDALRGFAVLAILLVHNLEHFIFPVYPDDPSWLDVVDKGVFSAVFALFAGKAYAIFALLFGFTFYIQSHNQRVKGKDFGYRFLWRILLLAGFATLNAAFFPAGDVLLLFVCISLVLFVARNWSDRAILAASVFFLLQPVEWAHCIYGVFHPSHTLPDLNVGAMYAEVADYTREGNFWKFIAGNITLGQKASLLWAVNAGRFFQTAGLFLAGLYLGRRGLFVQSPANNRRWIRILIVSAVAFAPLYALHDLIMADGSPLTRQTAGTAFDMWQKLAFTFVLTSSFILLYNSERFARLTASLRSYGRMSLTNYISQSIIGAFVYFPFGLFLARYCGYTLSLLVGIATFFLQIRFSRWWLSRHRQGPLETLWHKWTWIGTRN